MQTVATAYLKNKQLLLFILALHSTVGYTHDACMRLQYQVINMIYWNLLNVDLGFYIVMLCFIDINTSNYWLIVIGM